ncbi:MAG TPA: hypothetical protein VMU02_05785 [bacterium]|nr:hypothetical protein [bacterium]
MKNWIQTYTGKKFELLSPTPDMFDPLDIAHALSMLCRYTGHVDRFYSVAEHSLMMSWYCPAELGFVALMHDATEAYVNDLSKPLKDLLPSYEVIERNIYLALAERFNLPENLPAEIKTADRRMLITEHKLLMKTPPDTWGYEGYAPFNIDGFSLFTPREAKAIFLDRFYELGGK